MTWELRRFCASVLFWIQVLLFFCLVLFVTWSTRMPGHPLTPANGQGAIDGFIAGTSAWGLLTSSLPTGPLLLLVLLLPFVTADGVTRDVHRRTHELLLTTALPTWAYVWGRYLIGLVMSLGLAGLALVATLVMGWLSHLIVPAYPLPPTGAVLVLWIGMVVPATILVSSLSFALGTVFPRQSMLVKIALMVAWIVGAMIFPSGFGQSNPPPAWYVNWDPTSVATAQGLLSQYVADFGNQARAATSSTQFQQILLTVENKIPALAGWFVPHLVLAGVSLGLVLVASLAFQRSRDTLS
jgi:ABC-type transport system involved in multi-copper enzyme maturation permease subunit